MWQLLKQFLKPLAPATSDGLSKSEESYLNQATDIYDLERRQQQLTRKRINNIYRFY